MIKGPPRLPRDGPSLLILANPNGCLQRRRSCGMFSGSQRQRPRRNRRHFFFLFTSAHQASARSGETAPRASERGSTATLRPPAKVACTDASASERQGKPWIGGRVAVLRLLAIAAAPWAYTRGRPASSPSRAIESPSELPPRRPPAARCPQPPLHWLSTAAGCQAPSRQARRSALLRPALQPRHFPTPPPPPRHVWLLARPDATAGDEAHSRTRCAIGKARTSARRNGGERFAEVREIDIVRCTVAVLVRARLSPHLFWARRRHVYLCGRRLVSCSEPTPHRWPTTIICIYGCATRGR